MSRLELVKSETLFCVSKDDDQDNVWLDETWRWIRKSLLDITHAAQSQPHQVGWDQERTERYSKQWNRLMQNRFKKEDVRDVFYTTRTRLQKLEDQNKKAQKSITDIQKEHSAEYPELDNCLRALKDAHRALIDMQETLDDLAWMHR